MPKEICIVIPAYKTFEQLNQDELISWHQCLRILSKYPIYIAGPAKLAADGYIASAREKNAVCQFIAFTDTYFNSVSGYNSLMLSHGFYQKFKQYNYMLLYQLDCFIFKDELHKWCAQGYSYVGAPWFEGYEPKNGRGNLWKVGNGGFSLRNVQDCLRVRHTFSLLKSWSAVIEKHKTFNRLAGLRGIYHLSKSLIAGNNTHWLLNDAAYYDWLYQEDYYWGVVCDEQFDWYKVPTPKQALKFGFEVAPSIMYALNDNHLPMGCHAWEKYEPQFWQPFIEAATQ